MTEEKVVARYKDKSVLKGKTSNFSRGVTAFYLHLIQGGVVRVVVEDLKAVFMVKTFEGNRDHTYTYKDNIPWGGLKIQVQFHDGEEMIGFTPYYPDSGENFILTPADLSCNNKEVYVVYSAIKQMFYL